MPKTNNRNIKILGAAWLVLGGLAFAIAQLIIEPSTAEDGIIGGLVFVVVHLVLGAVQMVNGLSLLHRNRVARRLITISSLVLLIPSAASALSGIGIIFLLVVVYSLWLTLSRSGKERFESYMARENGRQSSFRPSSDHLHPRPYGVRTLKTGSSS